MEPLPGDVRQFLESSIDSIDQLEILRVLDEDQAREWRDDELGKQIQSTPERMLTDLATLEGRALLRCVRREGHVYCSYGPHSPELGSQVRRLLDIYRQRPVTMIRMVYERKGRVLRDFADAFRLKKEI